MKAGCCAHAVTRYSAAILAVGCAMLVTKWLKGFGDSGISPQFFAAVLASAWIGGLGPGLLATLLSGAAAAYLLMTPHATAISVIRDDFLRPLVFMIVAFLASSLHAATQRVAQEADRAKRAAESANEAKSRFLAMVSHELRTPLSPILMLTEMLQSDPQLPEHIRDDIRSIRRNVDVELRLIDDLVDLTRINSGKLNLQLEEIDINQPLLAAVGVCEADIRAKHLKLVLQVPNTGGVVRADAVRLQQVFWNLLRNAIKFTPEGGQLTISSEPATNHSLEVRVADTGIGIAPDRLTSIFDIFEQGEAGARFGGLGLGLAICQAMVTAHGGSITASTEGKDRGAVFTVRLPAATLARDSELPREDPRTHVTAGMPQDQPSLE